MFWTLLRAGTSGIIELLGSLTIFFWLQTPISVHFYWLSGWSCVLNRCCRSCHHDQSVFTKSHARKLFLLSVLSFTVSILALSLSSFPGWMEMISDKKINTHTYYNFDYTSQTTQSGCLDLWVVLFCFVLCFGFFFKGRVKSTMNVGEREGDTEVDPERLLLSIFWFKGKGCTLHAYEPSERKLYNHSIRAAFIGHQCIY